MQRLFKTGFLLVFPCVLVLSLGNCGSKSGNMRTSHEVNLSRGAGNFTVNGDVYGYEAAFDKKLAALGELSIDAFEKKYGVGAEYQKTLSYDPAKAKYFPELQKSYYKMNGAELALYKKNGFVVHGRLGMSNFANAYYRIFKEDLPVFVTADSVMHAWHRTFDAMLEEMEVKQLSPLLEDLLAAMSSQVKGLYGSGRDTRVKLIIKAVDAYIAVARSLLSGSSVAPALGDNREVEAAIRLVSDMRISRINIFGATREMDFGMFRPRGHYTKSQGLQRYFRAMMWLGRVDMRIVPQKGADNSNQVLAALTMLELLQNAKKYEAWKQFDSLMTTLIGKTDSATFADLDLIRQAAGFKGLASCTGDSMKDLMAMIHKGSFGMQAVNSAITRTSESAGKVVLPRSFTFLGQKFTMDAWGMGKVVYDRIKRGETKILRTRPSALDVAFSIFGSSDAVETLVKWIRSGTVTQRDRLQYQHNLAAVKEVVDERPAKEWSESVYSSWLNTLRALSNGRRDKTAPELFRTRAWAMRVLNTQLASWTQLRHDTLLYVKPTFGMGTTCFYPHGYVEPNVLFWTRLGELARGMAARLEKVSFSGSAAMKEIRVGNTWKKVSLKTAQVTFLRHFAATVDLLKNIARKQGSQEKLSAEEQNMLKHVVEIRGGFSGPPTYNGWYPGLFYKGRRDCKEADALVADVYSVPGGPGVLDGVLHQAVGKVDTLIAAVKNGTDLITYVGPTLSHYEFFARGNKRYTDNDWKQLMESKDIPPRPRWTKSYLLP
ncbi:DUF3160 domain-containing protein [Myxococcota bacterium]|nr:DUF3160 domain-containing protein [Myxococcota bacterium]